MNQFWFVSIRNEWGEGSSTEGGVQHQQESVCTGWCAGGAGRTPISRPLQEHPPYPSPPGFHWSVFVVIRDVSPMFLWRMLIFTDIKVKMLTQDQTPTDLKSFSHAAYCIFMIILLLRLTCSMHTFFKCWSSYVHVYAWSFWRTLEVNQFNLLWWNWTIETWHQFHKTLRSDSIEKSFYTWGIVILAWWECTYKILHQFDELEETACIC